MEDFEESAGYVVRKRAKSFPVLLLPLMLISSMFGSSVLAKVASESREETPKKNASLVLATAIGVGIKGRMIHAKFNEYHSTGILQREGDVVSPFVVVEKGKGYPVCNDFAKLLNQPQNDEYRLQLHVFVPKAAGNDYEGVPQSIDIVLSPKLPLFVFPKWENISVKEGLALATENYRPWFAQLSKNGKSYYQKAAIDFDNRGESETMMRMTYPGWKSWMLFPTIDAPPQFGKELFSQSLNDKHYGGIILYGGTSYYYRTSFDFIGLYKVASYFPPPDEKLIFDKYCDLINVQFYRMKHL